MKKFIFFDAFKFGYYAFFKNAWFILLSFFTSIGVFFGGLVFGGAIALIPLWIIFDKLVSSINTVLSFVKMVPLGTQQKILATIYGTYSYMYKYHPYNVLMTVFGFMLFLIFSYVLFMNLIVGFEKVILAIVDKSENKISRLFSRFGMVLKASCIGLISLIVLFLPWVITGFIVDKNVIVGAIIAGFSVVLTCYLPIKLSYSLWFLIDKSTGIFESIKLSFKLKNGYLNLLLLMLISLPIFIFVKFLLLVMGSVESLRIFAVLLGMILQFIYSSATIISVGYLYRNISRD
jgi:hypothetical protein